MMDMRGLIGSELKIVWIDAGNSKVIVGILEEADDLFIKVRSSKDYQEFILNKKNIVSIGHYKRKEDVDYG